MITTLVFAMASLVPTIRAASLPRPLRGIVVPLVTPLDAGGGLDDLSFARLIDHVIAGGVSGVMVLGSTGEGPALGHELRERVVDRAVALTRGRVPVLVNVSSNALGDALALARRADAAGAAALVISPPSYFTLRPAEMLTLFQRVAAATPRPVFLYNIPSMTHQRIDVDTVVAAARLPNVVGIKDSSGDRGYLLDLVTRFANAPEFSILVGEEALLAEGLALGVHGGVSGSANVRPRLFTDLHAAAIAGDASLVRLRTAEVAAWKQALRTISGAPNAAVAIFKTALALMKIIDRDETGEPLMGLDQRERAAVARVLPLSE